MMFVFGVGGGSGGLKCQLPELSRNCSPETAKAVYTSHQTKIALQFECYKQASKRANFSSKPLLLTQYNLLIQRFRFPRHSSHLINQDQQRAMTGR